MTLRSLPPWWAWLGGTLLVSVAVLAAGPLVARFGPLLPVAAIGLASVVAAAFVVWHLHPALSLTGAVVFSVFAGNWEEVGLTGALAPDRVLLLAALAAVLLRAPAVRDREPLPVNAVHWLLGALAVYAVTSAFFVGNLFELSSALGLFERLGFFAFLIYFAAPSILPTERERQLLLGGFLFLGAYLGLTALFETAGLDPLVRPSYILDDSVGIHPDRARGPFVEAVTNGVGLYACSVMGVIAVVTWRRTDARVVAAGITLLCTLGQLFTLTRSVWLAAVVATLLTLVVVKDLRRFLAPVIAGAVCLVGLAYLTLPTLRAELEDRGTEQSTVWDRQSLSRAAINMIETRPLFGFGWETFSSSSDEYFELSPDYPLTNVSGVEVHNVFLRYGVELGLVGTTLWLLATSLAVGGALLSRGPPQLRPWRIGLGAFAVFYVIVSSFVPPQLFPTLVLWLWAGVVWAGSRDHEATIVVEPDGGDRTRVLSTRRGILSDQASG